MLNENLVSHGMKRLNGLVSGWLLSRKMSSNMIRMVNFGPDSKLTCPYCGSASFHYPAKHRDATHWMQCLLGVDMLPERIELTCHTCGGVSYALPSDMITMKQTVTER